MLNYEKYTLDNGLNVILNPTSSETIDTLISVRHGALNEREHEHGIAHFLEHNLILGGGSRHKPSEIKNKLSYYGNWNAGTNLNRTLFNAGFVKDMFEEYLDLFSDTIFNPAFDENILEQERKRVLREIPLRSQESPAVEEYYEAMFGKNNPYRYKVIGNASIIEKANAQDLYEFYERGYVAQNTDLIIVGSIPKNAIKLIEKYFGNIKTGTKSEIILPNTIPLNKRFIKHVGTLDPNEKNSNNSLADIVITLPTDAINSLDSPKISVFNNILGGDPHSKLHEKISEELGLSYSIKSSYDCSYNWGEVNIRGTLHVDALDKGIDAIFDIFKHLQEYPVGEREIQRIKNTWEYFMYKRMETNEGILDTISKEIDHNINFYERIEKIKNCTAQDVQDMARKYTPSSFQDKFLMFISDPTKEKEV
ncbi:MAG TPA: pitrilysin family protein [Alphaproteobacteria bacterium]|nr:pitrilysin family protein [Alphaproteobacteria bacterium]